MKTSLFTIALAVATMVPVFGAQAQNPATPAKPDASNTQKPAAAATTKKHHKKPVKKSTSGGSGSAAATKPAGGSK
ncbi:MAG TPA: hypothetical protein VMH28_34365 [Candidatus Acidoferrales bacterium]|nr:hypothetical protein [Bryobacteraceae bacterium]HTS67176.1 hypothetical protein [Candidatus Acidoferrales bacterium]